MKKTNNGRGRKEVTQTARRVILIGTSQDAYIYAFKYSGGRF